MTAAFGARGSPSYGWETRYGAYRWDSESNFYQVRYRYLHPPLGRRLTRDPIGENSGLNLYAMVENNTVKAVDPFGLSFWDYLSISGTYRSCFRSVHGDNPNDYAGVGKLSCEACTFDKLSAEMDCERNVNLRSLSNIGKLVAPGLVKFGFDAILAGLALLGGLPGAIFSGSSVVDGLIGAGCTIKNGFNVKDAAEEAKKQQLKCPESR
jgi:RHS repeat-associated protein